jgi:hypothetical protein
MKSEAEIDSRRGKQNSTTEERSRDRNKKELCSVTGI